MSTWWESSFSSRLVDFGTIIRLPLPATDTGLLWNSFSLSFVRESGRDGQSLS